MEHILTSLDMFTDIAENLINYTFNVSVCSVGVIRRDVHVVLIFLDGFE